DYQVDKHSLELAIEGYGQALALAPRESDPMQWANAENDLGAALLVLGEHENGNESLEKAVAAYEAALTELTRERSPLYWAAIQNDYGWSLNLVGERLRSREMITHGKTALQSAWDEYKAAGYDYNTYFENRLAAFN